MAARGSKNGNGNGNGGHHPAILPVVIGAALTIVVGVVGFVVNRFNDYLTIREHQEYKANQEALSRENRANIDKLRDKYDALLVDMIQELRRTSTKQSTPP